MIESRSRSIRKRPGSMVTGGGVPISTILQMPSTGTPAPKPKRI